MSTPAEHQEWIKAIAQGDEGAFQSLYTVFADRVYNTVLSYLQNREAAAEVTQDVFVKIFRSASRFEGKSSVSTWIYRIAVNQSLDRISYLGRQKRFGILLRWGPDDSGKILLELPDFEHPGIVLEQKEQSSILFKAIEKLPAQQKTAFILSYVENLPRQEVADVMESSLKSVESLLQRAKANLRTSLKDWRQQSKDF
jgi:RNA polymerase sigma factor (sigma-70 family)